MDPRSARALLSVSFLLLLVVAGAVGNPAAGAAAAGLAALCALPAVVWGKRGVRIVGGLFLLASLAVTAVLLPGALGHMDAYRSRATRGAEGK
jgi:hypothetical protein